MSDRDRFDVEEGQEVVRHTIVGGRPRARRKRKIAIPIGIEKVLTRAAGDPGFRRRLFESRQAALASVGWELSPSEAVILGAVPNDVLDTMIGRIDLKQHAKRRFMKGIATAVFATAAMTSGVACTDEGDVGTRGIAPDDAIEADLGPGADLGIDCCIDVEDTAGSRGILPDADVEEIYPVVGSDVQRPEEVEINDGDVVLGDTADDPSQIDVTDDQPAVGGILPDINEVEVDQGQNDGGVRPDTDVTE